MAKCFGAIEKASKPVRMQTKMAALKGMGAG